VRAASARIFKKKSEISGVKNGISAHFTRTHCY
jgi:hypothetical protein